VLRHAFPDARHVLLEDPDVLRRVKADPRAFIDGIRPPVLLDEAQNAPELFGYGPPASRPWECAHSSRDSSRSDEVNEVCLAHFIR
jgi:hypothetical protein